ncbi:MAG: PepSY domain-containing protein, partial [Methylophilaceae bacterium]
MTQRQIARFIQAMAFLCMPVCNTATNGGMMRINIFKKTGWLFWHRWLGLITCFGILLWGLSGLSHPIMTRLQPVPTQFMPPAQHLDLSHSLSPANLLAMHHIQFVSGVSLIKYDDQQFFRVSTDASMPARYFGSTNGIEFKDGDQLYAEYLASHYSGRNRLSVTNSTLINQFSDEYPEVNRLLPVWRIAFAGNDHMRAFIDTDQARLATLSNDARYLLTKVFRFGHNWSFLDSTPRLQMTLMAFVLIIALISAISGLTLYVKRGRYAASRLANQPTRRWHRRIGLLVAISTLLFAGSGLFHLIMSFQQARQAVPVLAPELVDVKQLSNQVWSELATQTMTRLRLISESDTPLWMLAKDSDAPMAQVAMMSHEHHHAAPVQEPSSSLLINATESSETTPDLIKLAQTQAAHYAQLPIDDITATSVVSQFGGEYGFVFKRLPVIKVEFKTKDHLRLYIEPETGALAAQIRDIDATEGWSFAYLHKWEFANYNKDFRDILV